MKIKTLDLNEILAEFGDADAHSIDNATGICSCEEEVLQTVDVCPDCGIRIVWKRSRIWKEKFLRPRDELSQMLLRSARTRYFSNGHQLWRWRDAVENAPAVAREVVKRLAKEHRDRGLIPHVLNAIEYKIEYGSKDQKEDMNKYGFVIR